MRRLRARDALVCARTSRYSEHVAVVVSLDVPRLTHLHFAEDALPQQRIGFLGDLARPHLGAVLKNAVVLLGGVDHEPPFTKHVAGRLFAVDILACLHRASS